MGVSYIICNNSWDCRNIYLNSTYNRTPNINISKLTKHNHTQAHTHTNTCTFLLFTIIQKITHISSRSCNTCLCSTPSNQSFLSSSRRQLSNALHACKFSFTTRTLSRDVFTSADTLAKALGKNNQHTCINGFEITTLKFSQHFN